MRKTTAGSTAILLTLIASPAQAASGETGCYWPDSHRTVRVWVGEHAHWRVSPAVRIWNNVSAGQPRFRLVAHASRADVKVRAYREPGTLTNAVTPYSCRPGRSMHADIWVNNARGLSRAEKQVTIEHELGHVLGLAHRYSGRSLMRPRMREAADHPTRLDAATLRDIY